MESGWAPGGATLRGAGLFPGEETPFLCSRTFEQALLYRVCPDPLPSHAHCPAQILRYSGADTQSPLYMGSPIPACPPGPPCGSQTWSAETVGQFFRSGSVPWGKVLDLSELRFQHLQNREESALSASQSLVGGRGVGRPASVRDRRFVKVQVSVLCPVLSRSEGQPPWR